MTNQIRTLEDVFSAHSLGHFHSDDKVTVFFGNRLGTIEEVPKAFPQYSFTVLKQVHSSKAVEAPLSYESSNDFPGILTGPEVDAHWTSQRKLALCIRTADCQPVLMYSPSRSIIAAVHAGWKGLANRIILETFEHLKKKGVPLEELRVWIGPHIGATSFEVERDVSDLLQAVDQLHRGSRPEPLLTPQTGSAKCFVDLTRMAMSQVLSMGVPPENLVVSSVDTMTNPDYHSFRRENVLAGRQVSFIALN